MSSGTDWVVPPLPKAHSYGRSQVVYFWPGFKASAPEMGYPVLQPVLQFGQHGSHWELQSWFVDANSQLRYLNLRGNAEVGARARAAFDGHFGRCAEAGTHTDLAVHVGGAAGAGGP